MEMMIYKFLGVCCVIGVAILGWRILNWIWLTPKKLEKQLRQQGFNGKSYGLLSLGDIREMVKMSEEAKSKPIGLSGDILPRVLPVDLHTIANYGMLLPLNIMHNNFIFGFSISQIVLQLTLLGECSY